MLCNQCEHICLSCDDFDSIITEAEEISILRDIRRQLTKRVPIGKDKLQARFAAFIVSKVGTMTFFYFCCALSLAPLVYPATDKAVQYISSAFLQLVLLPLVMVAQNQQDKSNQMKADREYRILLVSDRIDEIMDGTK